MQLSIVVGVYVIWILDVQIEWKKKYSLSDLLKQGASVTPWGEGGDNKSLKKLKKLRDGSMPVKERISITLNRQKNDK